MRPRSASSPELQLCCWCGLLAALVWGCLNPWPDDYPSHNGDVQVMDDGEGAAGANGSPPNEGNPGQMGSGGASTPTSNGGASGQAGSGSASGGTGAGEIPLAPDAGVDSGAANSLVIGPDAGGDGE